MPRVLMRRAIFAMIWASAVSISQAALAQHPDLDGAGGGNAVCFECHEDVRESMGGVAHKPAEENCAICHDVVKQQTSPYLRAAPNGLCLSCHRTNASPQAPATSIEIAPGFTVQSSLAPNTKLSLDARGAGHPVTNHPVEAASDPHAKDRPLTCVSCHRPHGGREAKLLAFDLEHNQGVCRTCHEL